MLTARTEAAIELAALMQAVVIAHNNQGIGLLPDNKVEQKMYRRIEEIVNFLGLNADSPWWNKESK